MFDDLAADALRPPQLRRILQAGLGADPSETDIGRLYGAVRALATQAYVKHEAAKFATAEELLYIIHQHTRYASPCGIVPALVYHVLMDIKLSAWHSLAEVPEVTLDQLDERFQRLLSELGTPNHPLFELFEAQPDMAGYKVWAKNWFRMAHGFADQLTTLSRRTVGLPRRMIIENLSEEVAEAVTHLEHRSAFCASLGLTFGNLAELTDGDVVPESFSISNFRAGVCQALDPLVGLGVFWATEANWQLECAKHLGFLKRRNWPKESLTYWTGHLEGDERHADEWAHSVREAARTPRELGLVLLGAEGELRTRRRAYTAIYERLRGRS